MEFNWEKYKNFLSTPRYLFFSYIIEKLIKLNKPLNIIETGCMWSDIKHNQGAFTLIFSDLIKNYTGGSLTTIDISENAINKCKITTKEHADVIKYIISDSVKYLQTLTDDEIKNVDLFYLDSYDLNLLDPIPSQLHHYRELSSIYDNLSDDVIIVVDDNFKPPCWVEWKTVNNGESVSKILNFEGNRIIGKGTLIDCFLLQEGWVRFEDDRNTGVKHMLAYQRK